MCTFIAGGDIDVSSRIVEFDYSYTYAHWRSLVLGQFCLITAIHSSSLGECRPVS